MVVKREDGFGFTLTQEMPVFVDKVFNGSSAQKAGIHPKDRIIKVGGCGLGVAKDGVGVALDHRVVC